MGLRVQQIENVKCIKVKPKAGFRKWLKKQRNRHIRRTALLKEPFTKYHGTEY
jgi:hypothetical protein